MQVVKVLFLTLILAAAAFAQQNLKAGEAAPDFSIESIDGSIYNLRELQGKVVVLTFWSTKCQICHSEIPKLNQVAERYKGKDVVFLALTMENQARVEPYLRKYPFNFSIVPNSFGMVLKYANKDSSGNIDMGFPAHFVINRKGQISHRTHGWDKAANLDSQISRVLAYE